MTIGLIAFALTFAVPFTFAIAQGSLFRARMEAGSVRHMNERLEQQGLGAVVTRLEVGASSEQEHKRAA